MTKRASSITQTSATLNATVNPNGSEVTECKFEYGRNIAYGKSVSCNPAPGSGTSPVTVSGLVSGFAPNTTWHFRISATNAGGTSTGGDVTFTTLPDPPTVETKVASAVTETSATLSASVNPNAGQVSDCHFEYGTTTSYGSSAPCTPSPGSGISPVEVSGSATGLSPNTTYHFTVTATNTGGTSTGSDVTFSTATPRYYANGMRLKEGAASTRTSIAWGDVTLKGTKGFFLGGHVTCHAAAAGTLFNPEDAGAGEGLIEVFAPFACEQELICPSKTTQVALTAESVPWHDVLTEQVPGTIRQETTSAKLGIECFEGSLLISDQKIEPVAAEKKGLRPKIVDGTEAVHPSLLEYGEGSGELECEGCGGTATLKPEGAIKLFGYNAQELIAVKNP